MRRSVNVSLPPNVYQRLSEDAGKARLAPSTYARNLIIAAVAKPGRQAAEAEVTKKTIGDPRCGWCQGRGFVTYERKVEDAGAAQRNVKRTFAKPCGCRRPAPF